MLHIRWGIDHVAMPKHVLKPREMIVSILFTQNTLFTERWRRNANFRLHAAECPEIALT